MSMKQKILSVAIIPVIILGLITMFLTMTVVKNSMIDEIQEALKGTAAATLAAYDQNTGDYIESQNGDVWKGGYNVSKSENLVDKIKANSGMDVTFFYGEKRIMTSAFDKNGERILGSPVGATIREKVLENGEEYFCKAVSLGGTLTYGYYMPVYQNGTTENPIGIIFVGTNKEEKDAAINQILSLIGIVVVFVMGLCIIAALQIAVSISKNMKSSIEVVKTVAEGKLNIEIKKKLLLRKDEVGELSRAMQKLRDALYPIIQEIFQNTRYLLDSSETLETVADYTNETMQQVKEAVNQITETSTKQAQNSQSTSEFMKVMGEDITKTSLEANLLNQNAVVIRKSSEKATDTLSNLYQINYKVEEIIKEIQIQTNHTNESVQKIHQSTELISSIAEETNLLSLNASIEAARAGESGKGFAVVADKIQSLAEQSNETNQYIEETVQSLMEDSAKMIAIVQKMQEIIANQNESMKDTSSSVKEVLEEIIDSMHSMEMIQDSAKRLESSRNKVLQEVNDLSEIAQDNASSTKKTYYATQETAASFEKVSISAGKIREIANQLEKSIEYFQV